MSKIFHPLMLIFLAFQASFAFSQDTVIRVSQGLINRHTFALRGMRSLQIKSDSRLVVLEPRETHDLSINAVSLIKNLDKGDPTARIRVAERNDVILITVESDNPALTHEPLTTLTVGLPEDFLQDVHIVNTGSIEVLSFNEHAWKRAMYLQSDEGSIIGRHLLASKGLTIYAPNDQSRLVKTGGNTKVTFLDNQILCPATLTVNRH